MNFGLFEFNAQANSFIVALNTKMLEKEISQLGEFNVRVIQAMHVMLVGHRRTLQHMVEKINNILLSERITEDLRGIINRKKRVELLLLLMCISAQEDVFTFNYVPETEIERNTILGITKCDAIINNVFRDILSTNKRFIRRRICTFLGGWKFMVTKMLSCFFKMIQPVADTSDIGHLSRAAGKLFCALEQTVTLSTVWECCRVMTGTSRALCCLQCG